MSKNAVAGIVSVAVLVVSGAGWFLLPSLQDSARIVEADASVKLERARRLLHSYSARLAYKSLLVDQLAEDGIEVDPEGVSDALADDYQQMYETMWEAYPPQDWRGDAPTPARIENANLAGQINTGLNARARLVSQNEELLKDALGAVEEALDSTSGSVSARSHAEANRLKGVILLHMGSAERMRARLHRRTAMPYRRQLISLAATGGVLPGEGGEAENRLDAQIDRLEAGVAEMNASVAENRNALLAMDAKIETLENKLAAAESRRADADAAKQQLLQDGVDFSDAKGGETFRIRLEELDGAFRKADRLAKSLLMGNYPNARMEGSRDYLTGRYVERGSTNNLTIERGLTHYRSDRALLALKDEVLRRAVDNLRSGVVRVKKMKEAWVASHARARERITESTAEASEVYAEMNRIDAEAFTTEDAALELLTRSARVSKQAAGYADQLVRDASERTREMSPDAQQRSAFQVRSTDGWMSGFIAAQEADANLAKAWIHYDRYLGYTRNAETLALVAEALQLGEAHVDSERTKATDAHDAGVEAITQAMNVLQAAHRKTGNDWTVMAEAAGVTYLMVLFGHDDYLDDAIEAYRNAVKSREDEQFARVFVNRLTRLENR